jgi:hypothetical protein
MGPAAIPSRSSRRLSLECSDAGEAREAPDELAESSRECIDRMKSKTRKARHKKQDTFQMNEPRENKRLSDRLARPARSDVKPGDDNPVQLVDTPNNSR